MSGFLTPEDEMALARERVEAQLPWWWRRRHQERVMALVERYARTVMACELLSRPPPPTGQHPGEIRLEGERT